MDLKQILELHKKWLNNGGDGKRANLRSADLSGANLRSANLRSANLRSADLSGADLSCADLRGADLSGAYLSGADLRCADLRSADLRDAYLSGANLSGAGLWNTIGNQVEIFTFQTNKYPVVICQDRIQIGCKNFSQSEWFNFSDGEITKMDSDALDWWWKHKQHVKTWCEIVNSYSK